MPRFGTCFAKRGAMSDQDSALSISNFMTALPQTVGRDQPLQVALDLMRELGVRHLPVLHGGRLVGVLSERDILLVQSLPGVDADKIRVEEAMSHQPYHVAPSASLGEVAREMAENKYGAAIIMDANKLAGVFTTVDALKILAQKLGA